MIAAAKLARSTVDPAVGSAAVPMFDLDVAILAGIAEIPGLFDSAAGDFDVVESDPAQDVASLEALADDRLLDLIQRVRVFGFHLASLDVREAEGARGITAW